MYALFPVEPLGMFKMLTEGVFEKMSSDTILTNHMSMSSRQSSLLQVRKSVLRDCNTYPAAMEKDGGGPSLKVYFSRSDTSSYFSWLISNTCIRRMRQGKDYSRLDMVISFVS